MPKYLILFSFEGETIGRLKDNPSDRSEVVRDLVGQLGGDLECYYFMLGQYDGALICNLPDSASAVALGVAATGTGSFSHYETHELISTQDMLGILERAKALSYRPPGT